MMSADPSPGRSRLWLWTGGFYLAATLVGGALLLLPQSASPELRFEEGDYYYKRMLNCAFTSASALTLTGLPSRSSVSSVPT